MELIQMGASNPKGLKHEQLFVAIRALLPFQTGAIELEQDLEKEIVFQIACEEGAYDDYPNGAEFGPDVNGVVVQWDTP